jgi:hypothetical protein
VNYEEELSKLSNEQLDAMIREGENAFPPELWGALEAELRMRALSPQMRETIRRSSLPRDQCQDVAGWIAVATVMKAGLPADDVFKAISQVIATDPLYSSFGQPGYPLDLQVSFPATALEAEHLKGDESMWVRTIGIGPEPNHWVGRLLNAPRLFELAAKDAYIEFRAENTGLKFVRVVER